MWTIAQIREAIDDERQICRHPIQSRVIRSVRGRDGFRIDIDPFEDRHNRPIDEALEGSRAWWVGDTPSSADVYAVDPDVPSVFLKRLTGGPPNVGETMSIYEPD